MKNIILCMFLCLGFWSKAQVNYFQGFESDTTNNWPIVQGASYVSNDNGSSYLPANQTIKTGSFSWQLQGTASQSLTDSLVLQTISFSPAKRKLSFQISCVAPAGKGLTTNSDHDFLEIWVKRNGGTYSRLAYYEPYNTNKVKWGYNGFQGYVFNTYNGLKTSPPYTWSYFDSSKCVSNVYLTIDNSYTSLSLKIVAKSGSQETVRWCVDNIRFADSNGSGCSDSYQEFYEVACGGVVNSPTYITSNMEFYDYDTGIYYSQFNSIPFPFVYSTINIQARITNGPCVGLTDITFEEFYASDYEINHPDTICQGEALPVSLIEYSMYMSFPYLYLNDSNNTYLNLIEEGSNLISETQTYSSGTYNFYPYADFPMEYGMCNGEAEIYINGLHYDEFEYTEGIKFTVISVDLSLQNGVLTASGAGGVYEWYKDGSLIPNVSTSTFTPTSPGLYTVIAPIYNSLTGSTMLCTSQTQIQVTCQDILMPLSAQAPSQICIQENFVLEASSSFQGLSFFWTGPNGFSSTAQNPVISNADTSQSGNYQVFAIANGCTTATQTVHVQVLPKPSNQIIGTNNLCSGDHLFLIPGSSLYDQILWSGPNGFNSMLDSVQINNISSLHAGTYQMVCIVNGCSSDVQSIQIQVNEKPNPPVINSAFSVCEHSNYTFSTSAGPNAQYIWSGPNGFQSNDSTPSISNVSLSDSGTYFVSVVMNGCTSTVSQFNLSVVKKPEKALTSFNGQVCTGSEIQLQATHPQATSFYWSGPNGFSSTLQNPLLTNTNPQMSGLYQVVVEYNSCFSDTADLLVNIFPIPTAPTSMDLVICENSTTSLTASNGTSYAWYDVSSGGTVLSNSANFTTPNLTSNTTYYVENIANGCTSARTAVTVNVNPIPTAPTSTNLVICENSTASLTASNGTSYAWYEVSSGGTVLSNSASFSTPNLTANTTYYVENIANGCTSSRTAVTVNVNAVNASFSANTNTLTASPSGATYQWLLNGTPISGATSETFVITQSGQYAVIVTQNGCSDTTANQTITFTTLDFDKQSEIKVYPNPFENEFKIQVPEAGETYFVLFDLLGKEIKAGSFTGTELAIPMQNLSKGTYLLRVISGSKAQEFRLVKN